MRRILEERNRRLRRDLEFLLQLLRDAPTLPDLQPYRDRVAAICREQRTQADRNLTHLDLDQVEILPDVLNATTQITRTVRLLGTRLLPPIRRASWTDRLSLATIRWLHDNHPEAKRFPPAFSDGDVAILPFLHHGVLLYFFPSIEQRGLLYQSLYFHEFGHLLYALHQRELDDLVDELRRTIHDVLLPASQRNDRYADRQAQERRVIVRAWYRWAQEFFCDAVGFAIGGPSFLRAFSNYLSHLAKADFYRPLDRLRVSEHPVTWLRIQFLTRRALREGFTDLAWQIDEEWRTIKATLAIDEDHHGFYVDAMETAVEGTIADMLTEASPRPFTVVESAGGGWSADTDSLIRLLNWAWQAYDAKPEGYPEWEAGQITRLLNE